MTALFDFLNSINHSKEDLIRNDPDCVKDYNPFIINRGLSMNLDTILYCNEMNLRPGLDKQQQYDFLRLSVPKRKRYAKWAKKDTSSEDIEAIKSYYKYSSGRAVEALELLTADMINIIKGELDPGGRRNR